MNIVKLGNVQNRPGEFHFVCEKCGCEWYADRGDNGLKISPPCCKYYAYMKCPSCGTKTTDEDNKFSL